MIDLAARCRDVRVTYDDRRKMWEIGARLNDGYWVEAQNQNLGLLLLGAISLIKDESG